MKSPFTPLLEQKNDIIYSKKNTEKVVRFRKVGLEKYRLCSLTKKTSRSVFTSLQIIIDKENIT
jgi:hypothetical protein